MLRFWQSSPCLTRLALQPSPPLPPHLSVLEADPALGPGETPGSSAICWVWGSNDDGELWQCLQEASRAFQLAAAFLLSSPGKVGMLLC